MARVFQYVRPVDAVLTSVLLGTRSELLENGIRIKEEPPDLVFDDLNASLSDVDTAAQNVFTLPEQQSLNDNNENNTRRLRPKSVDSNKNDSSKKRKHNATMPYEAREANQIKRARLFVDNIVLLQMKADFMVKDETTCKICFVNFKTTNSLNYHVKIYNTLLSCEICNAMFHSRSQLQNHLPTHFRQKTSFRCRDVCWFCRREFRDKKHLQMHMFHCHRNLLQDQQLLETDISRIVETILEEGTAQLVTNDSGRVEVSSRTKNTRLDGTNDVDNIEKDTPENKSTTSVSNHVDKTKNSKRATDIPVRVTRNSERMRKNTSTENSMTPETNDVGTDTPMKDSTTHGTNNVDQVNENIRMNNKSRIPSDAIKVERDIWSEDAIITITSDDELDETKSMEDIMNIIGVSNIVEENSRKEDSANRAINNADQVEEVTRTNDIMNIIGVTNNVTNGTTNDITNVASVTAKVANVAGVTGHVADVVDASTNNTNVIGVINDVGKSKENAATENSANGVINEIARAADATATVYATNNVETAKKPPTNASGDNITKDTVKTEENTPIDDNIIRNIKIEPDTLAENSVGSANINVNQTDPNTSSKDSTSGVTNAVVKIEQDTLEEDSAYTAMANVDLIAPSTSRKDNATCITNEIDQTQRNVLTPNNRSHKKKDKQSKAVSRISTPTKSSPSTPGKKRMRQTTLTEFISFSGKDVKEDGIKLEKVDIPEEGFDVNDRNTRSSTFGRTSTLTPKSSVRDTAVNTSGRNTPLLRMHMNPDSIISLLNDQIKIECIDPFGTNVVQNSPYNFRKSTHDSRRSSVDSLDTAFPSTASRKSRHANTTKQARRSGMTLEERWKKKYGCKECVVRLERYDYTSKQVLIKTSRSKSIIPLQLTIGKADKSSLNGKESGSPKIRIVNFDNCIVVELLEPR